MRKIVVFFVCIILVVLFSVSIYGTNKLSIQFDNLQKYNINKLGVVNNGIEHLFYDGTMEFELIRNKLFDLFNELHEPAPALKRGESKKAGIMKIYDKEILFTIYLYMSITATPEKSWGEVPGKQLAPIIARFHCGGLLEYVCQILGGVPAIRLRRFYQRI